MPEAHAYVDYSGEVWVCYPNNSDNDFLIQLALDDQFRGQQFPVEEFHGDQTIVFPFGRYYL